MIGLPSLRALDRAQGTRIWLAVEPADMRCGFDRLAERVRGDRPGPFERQSYHLPLAQRDRLKILMWDRDGCVLWYK